MDLRLQALAAWLRSGQGAVWGCLAFWAFLLLSWAPDEDEISTVWNDGRAQLQAGATSAVLILLAVVSAAAGVARLLNRTGGTGSLVAAHLGGAVAVSLYGLPGVAAVLAVAACAWPGVLSRDNRLLLRLHRPSTSRSTADYVDAPGT